MERYISEMATRKKIDKFLYLHEKEKIKKIFGTIELFQSTLKNDLEKDLVDDIPTDLTPVLPVQSEPALGTSTSCSCCQVKFDSGKWRVVFIKNYLMMSPF